MQGGTWGEPEEAEAGGGDRAERLRRLKQLSFAGLEFRGQRAAEREARERSVGYPPAHAHVLLETQGKSHLKRGGARHPGARGAAKNACSHYPDWKNPGALGGVVRRASLQQGAIISSGLNTVLDLLTI